MKSKTPIARVRADAKRGQTLEEMKGRVKRDFAKQLGFNSIEELDAALARRTAK